MTGGSRPPILRLHSDKASEFLSPPIRAYPSQQRVHQTVNSGYDPQANGLAERWIGIFTDCKSPCYGSVSRCPPTS